MILGAHPQLLQYENEPYDFKAITHERESSFLSSAFCVIESPFKLKNVLQYESEPCSVASIVYENLFSS